MSGAADRAVMAVVALLACGCAPREAADAIVVSGHIEATEVRISAEAPGRLLELPLREGDRVSEAQLLARVDGADTELALRGARAERAQAAAQLELLQAGPRREEIAEAAARADQAEAERAGAERELERMQGLLKSGSGTERARDEALTRRDAAASALAAAREWLGRLQAGARAEEVQAARARLAAAEAGIAQLEKQLADAVVRSPVAGLVTARLAEPGELVGRGSGLLLITRLDAPWLTVYLGEPDLGRVRLGQPAEVVTDGGERRSGRLSFIASQAEFTPKNVQTRDERVKLVYRVEIALDNADGLFKPGMPAEARLTAAGGGA